MNRPSQRRTALYRAHRRARREVWIERAAEAIVMMAVFAVIGAFFFLAPHS